MIRARFISSSSRRGCAVRLVVGCAAVMLLASASNAAAQHGHARPNIDVRYDNLPAAGAEPVVGTGLPITQGVTAGGYDRPSAQQQLEARVGRVGYSYDPVFNTPRYIRSTSNFLLEASPEEGRDVTLKTNQFMDEYRGLMLVEPDEIDHTRVIRHSVSEISGAEHIRYCQQIDGIDIFGAELRATVNEDGHLVNISSLLLDSRRIGAFDEPQTAELTAELALIRAAADLGVTLNPLPSFTVDDSQPSQPHTFSTTDQLWYPATASLAYFPMSQTEVKLAWRVIIGDPEGMELYQYLINADSAAVMYRETLTHDATPASYRVYTSDNPAPLSPFPPGFPLNFQAVEVGRELRTLDAIDDDASPNGWINAADNDTIGNNVYTIIDRDHNFIADTEIVGVPDRVFDFPLDLAAAPSTYAEAACVNLFYWCNFCHDRMYQLGFDEASGNFQESNFGRGGFGNDSVLALAQAGADVGLADNANFSTPPDGNSGLMRMYEFTGPNPNRDSSLEAGIIIHEYTHGLSNRLHGSGGLSASQSRGMGEGWSDFYAISLLSSAGEDPDGIYPSGGYVTANLVTGYDQNYYFGIRRYPYSTNLNVNPLTFEDIDPFKISLPDNVPQSPALIELGSNLLASEVHNAGEVWCTMLWECRANIVNKVGFSGNETMLQIVTEAMKLSPPNPNFQDARDAIIQADVLVSGGQFFNELWDGFAKRGLGFSAIAPGAFGNIGVVEATDFPRPFAAARASATGGKAPLTINFRAVAENLAQGGRVDTWTFGDGSAEVGRNITHTFTEAGSYLAVFEAIDGTGASARASVSINVIGQEEDSQGTGISITGAPLNGTVPLTVQFKALVSGSASSIVSYTWAFGDGEGAVGQEVAHTFDTPGSFTVTLSTVDNTGGRASRTLRVTATAANNSSGGAQQFLPTTATRNPFCGAVGMVSMMMMTMGLIATAWLHRRRF